MKKVLALLFLAACSMDADLAPEVCTTPEPVTLIEGMSSTVTTCFTDPEGEQLTLTVMTSPDEVVTAVLSSQVVTVTALKAGTATVTVTATDPSGQLAATSFMVTVTASDEPITLLTDSFDMLADEWVKQDVTESGIENGRLWIATEDKSKIAIFSHAVGPAESPTIRARVENNTDDFWPTLISWSGNSRLAIVIGADIGRMSDDSSLKSNWIALRWDNNVADWALLSYGAHEAIGGAGTVMDVSVEISETTILFLVDGHTVIEDDRPFDIPMTIDRVSVGGTWPEDVSTTTTSRVYFDQIDIVGKPIR